MIRPAGGDSDRVADRHRVSLFDLRYEMRKRGLEYDDHAEALESGRPVVADDGTRFEKARN